MEGDSNGVEDIRNLIGCIELPKDRKERNEHNKCVTKKK